MNGNIGGSSTYKNTRLIKSPKCEIVRVTVSPKFALVAKY